MKNTLRILFTWLKYDHSQRDKCFTKNVSLLKYKIQYVYKDNVEDESHVSTNYKLPVAELYCINSEFMAHKNKEKKKEAREICVKKYNNNEKKTDKKTQAK